MDLDIKPMIFDTGIAFTFEGHTILVYKNCKAFRTYNCVLSDVEIERELEPQVIYGDWGSETAMKRKMFFDSAKEELSREATGQGPEDSGQAGSIEEVERIEEVEELPKCNTCKKEKPIGEFEIRKDSVERKKTCKVCADKYHKPRTEKALYLAGSIPTLCGYTKEGLDEALEAGTLVDGDVLVKVSIVSTFRVKKKISYSIEEV